MRTRYSRRKFVKLAAASAAAAALPAFPGRLLAEVLKSPFRVAVISDEITQDFERALQIISQDFGLQWVEVRGMWDKNLLKMDDNEINRARKLLDKYQIRVTDIASPLFKVDWPGAPRSKHSPQSAQFGADFSFKQQDEVLERSIEVARKFGTDRVRCFDFWRLEGVTPYRAAIDAKLQEAAERAGKQGITLLLENEMSCNTATGAEAARTLAAVPSRYLMLNWDAGNAAMAGEKAFSDGYHKLPQHRIGHFHFKDVKRKADGEGFEWAPMGSGLIDWLGQFRALKHDGYRLAVSLETHWRGAGTPEASSRASMAGMQKLLR